MMARKHRVSLCMLKCGITIQMFSQSCSTHFWASQNLKGWCHQISRLKQASCGFSLYARTILAIGHIICLEYILIRLQSVPNCSFSRPKPIASLSRTVIALQGGQPCRSGLLAKVLSWSPASRRIKSWLRRLHFRWMRKYCRPVCSVLAAR